ncbi:MAG: hypothetical protein ACJAXZ_001834 [Akkermansiaceae bacterium]
MIQDEGLSDDRERKKDLVRKREGSPERLRKNRIGNMVNTAIVRARFKYSLTLGIAAVALVGIGLFLFTQNRVTDELIGGELTDLSSEDVALLSQVADVVWESSELRAGTGVKRGKLAISSGSIALSFYSGASVYVQGPVRIEIFSQELIRVESGRLSAQVPPPARGFTVLSGSNRIVDLGTEFGIDVRSPDDCEIHVFDGEVEFYAEDVTQPRSILGGEALVVRDGGQVDLVADRSGFSARDHLQELADRQSDANLREWKQSKERFQGDPSLLVHYDFQNIPNCPSRLENKVAGGGDGFIVGCDRLPGRWLGKEALGFTSSSDRVLLKLEGTTPSLTLLASIRIDSLAYEHNALLSMAPNRKGETHWKLDRQGRLLLGLRAESKYGFDGWERLVSPPIIDENRFGQWIRVATVIDGEAGMLRHFLDGKEIASAKMTRQVNVQLGIANIGNFDESVLKLVARGGLRSFNGRIDDLMLFSRALSAEEIAAHR